jgi:hypothetical protein
MSISSALAEVGDRDNNHHFCLDTVDPAISVAFPAVHLVDPNQDLNAGTRIRINRGSVGFGSRRQR